ncbi:MAG: hypothetical protein CV089_09090 [Nitrospira sp. WS110]|nr:hypothetical protein [Nitrospira sp. WS110]
MAHIITVSMVCFPYVMAGLGQAIIVGTHSAGRPVPDTAATSGRKIPLPAREDHCKVCFIPGCPLFAPR